MFCRTRLPNDGLRGTIHKCLLNETRGSRLAWRLANNLIESHLTPRREKRGSVGFLRSKAFLLIPSGMYIEQVQKLD